MKLSVILPIYNGETTLTATLESLANQTFKDFELIACIDGTKDNSVNILQRYKNAFKELVILENPVNMGLGATMNRLVSNAKGDYIAVAEQDDYYYPERLALQLEVLDSKPEVGLVSGIADFWDGTKITSRFPGLLVSGKTYPQGKELFLLMYRQQSKIVNSCMMFRKAVHINKGLYFSKHYPSISVDWSYFLRFSLVSKVYGIPKSLVRLDRRHNRNSVTSKKQVMFKASRELIQSFAYEYPEIISKEDYEYALNTQKLLELSHHSKIKFLTLGLFYMIRYPNDSRFSKKVIEKLFKKLR